MMANMVRHRMLYSCTHTATEGVKGLMLILIDIDKQLSHVLQTFKEKTDESCRVGRAAQVLWWDMEVQHWVARHHVWHTVAVVWHRSEATTRTQLYHSPASGVTAMYNLFHTFIPRRQSTKSVRWQTLTIRCPLLPYGYSYKASRARSG